MIFFNPAKSFFVCYPSQNSPSIQPSPLQALNTIVGVSAIGVTVNSALFSLLLLDSVKEKSSFKIDNLFPEINDEVYFSLFLARSARQNSREVLEERRLKLI
jgi:hypothetical protein